MAMTLLCVSACKLDISYLFNQAQLYKEDFASERSDRENAHEKLAELEEKHAEEVDMLTAKLLQMEELNKRKGKKLVMV